MIQTRLSTLDPPALAAAFNTIYEAYSAPISMGALSMAHHVESNDIQLAHSPLWLDADGNVAGLSMLGVRGDRGWIGGFGIARPQRRQGHSVALMHDALMLARSAGLRLVQLEVITSNIAAIRAYERAGFDHTRDLLVLTRPADARTLDIDTAAVQPIEPADAIAVRAGLGSRPAWQRERESLARVTDLRALSIGDPAGPLAVAIYQHTPDSVRVLDLGAQGVDSAQTLLAGLAERYPGERMTLVNEPEGSPMLPALDDTGWQEVLRQHEVVIYLAA